MEVLVGHSTSPNEFKVLLGTCTFMSVVESKQWRNFNRVRMFGKWSSLLKPHYTVYAYVHSACIDIVGKEKFNKEVAGQKWDRVKFICTQPYNKVSF